MNNEIIQSQIVNLINFIFMDNKNLDALIKSIKLVLRLYVFSVVPILGTMVLSGIDTTTGIININWALIKAVFIFQTVTFILAGLDKYKHEYLKSISPEDTKGQSMGIVKF